jgi:NTP pyrophosphatase (non-canonical NTP hydrolase)
MNEQEREVMNILSEECAEVIQAISKCHRFGLDNYKPGKPKTNCDHLQEEIGDLLAMVDILLDMQVISKSSLEMAKLAKIEKLKKWSNIQNLENI